jgi:hypothetical protein
MMREQAGLLRFYPFTAPTSFNEHHRPAKLASRREAELLGQLLQDV